MADSMKILVVDDDDLGRKIITRAFKKRGYTVLQAATGLQAVEVVEALDIGIVIADWMMPEMDGIDMVRRLRARNDAGYVYVIMLTARSEHEDMLAGFQAGVDEYMQKPPNLDELEARVKVGVRIVTLERRLMEERRKSNRFAEKMESLAAERALQLVHADRMASLGTLSAGIAHEINNPVSFISGNVQVLERFLQPVETMIGCCSEEHPDYESLQFVREELSGVIAGIKIGAERISRIVNGLKSFSRREQPASDLFEPAAAMDEALMLCANALKYGIEVHEEVAADLPRIKGDRQQISQVFVNLISNAADALENRENGKIWVRVWHNARGVFIRVEDNGPGLSPDVMGRIFNPFFTTKPVGKGTGLGLSVSHGIIASHGGDISAENRPGGGASFLIRLPVG